jgi:hypothetical protein
MPTMTVTWGERLKLHTERYMAEQGIAAFREVVDALNTVDRAVQNTWAKLFKCEERPTKYDDLRRAYLLALLIEHDPAEYGIKIIRPRVWPDDEELRDLLHDSLFGQNRKFLTNAA